MQTVSVAIEKTHNLKGIRAMTIDFSAITNEKEDSAVNLTSKLSEDGDLVFYMDDIGVFYIDHSNGTPCAMGLPYEDMIKLRNKDIKLVMVDPYLGSSKDQYNIFFAYTGSLMR